MGKLEECISEEKWDKCGSERAGASKVSSARRQPGGCRVVNSQAKTKTPPVSVIPFPEKSPGNRLGLVEGSCGKVTLV